MVVVGCGFFASFGVSHKIGASKEFLSFEMGREGFLRPTAPFESSGVDLLGSRRVWQPVGVGRLVSEMRVSDGVVGKVLMDLGRCGDYLRPGA